MAAYLASEHGPARLNQQKEWTRQKDNEGSTIYAQLINNHKTNHRPERHIYEFLIAQGFAANMRNENADGWVGLQVAAAADDVT